MGNIDLFHSRRTHYEECAYWVRNEKETGRLDEWIMKNKSNGVFYAKEVNPWYNQANPQANVFMMDKNVIALETNDDVEEIVRGCVVLYNGHPWIVDTVQKQVFRRESEFSSEKTYKTIISIRR